MQSVKSVVLFICALAFSFPAPAQTRPATAPAMDLRVDPRVEIVCIIFRLAGNPEYRRGMIPAYARDVDEHFKPVADHPAVQLARQLRSQRGVCYDAPMSLAVHLTDEFDEAVPLVPLPAEVDPRWPAEQTRRFVKEAKDFAQRGHFAEFLKAHRDLYDTTESRMCKTIEDHARLDWFDGYFGQRAQIRFHLVPALLNGGNCYGARIQTGQRTDMYCILGVWDADSSGTPRFAKSIIPAIVHEFCHSYVNPLVDRHLPDFEPAGRKLFAANAQRMTAQAYGRWDTVVRESVVRAAVVRYRSACDGPFAAAGEVMEQHARIRLDGRTLKTAGRLRFRPKELPALRGFHPAYRGVFQSVHQPAGRTVMPGLRGACRPGRGLLRTAGAARATHRCSPCRYPLPPRLSILEARPRKADDVDVMTGRLLHGSTMCRLFWLAVLAGCARRPSPRNPPR